MPPAASGSFAGLVARLGPTSVGEVYHVFEENAGFTAVLALTESHLSIHTWPEHGLATFDVFLSNFRRDNHATVRRIYHETLEQFPLQCTGSSAKLCFAFRLGSREPALSRRPVHLAHTDLSGVSVFEEAFHQGQRAARAVVPGIGAG